MSMGLTSRQRRLFDAIDAAIAAYGVAPTYKEMCAAVGVTSRSSVFRLINSLEERGYIRRMPNRARAIEIIPTRDAIELHPEVRGAAVAYARQHGISLSTAVSEAARAYFCGDRAA